jgi:hypothetical protein
MGGGHGDYAGNEIYGFSLDTLQWSRIWGPTPNMQIPDLTAGGNREIYLDGNPASRHTYSGIQYLPNVDRYFVHGGSLWSGSGGMGRYTWHFDPNASTWSERADISNCYSEPSQPYAVYDTGNGNVYAHKYNSLCQYNPIANAWTKRGGFGPGISTRSSAVFDSNNKLFCMIGDGSTLCYDMKSTGNTIQLQAVTTTGDKTAEKTSYPGVDYNPISKQIVAWAGGTDVYTLDLTTRVWTRVPAAPNNLVTPTAPTSTGSHGRWRYIQSKNVFIVVNGINQNVYAYKLSANSDTPTASTSPTAPTNLQIVEVTAPPTSQPPAGQIVIPTRQWMALRLPNLSGVPLDGGAKHMTAALNPRNGRVYFVGGDYNVMGGSYVQQVVSLSLKERLVDISKPNAGWRVDHPACNGPGGLTPKHPDFVGWLWDEGRGKFWYVPGTEVLADTNCEGETQSKVSDPNFTWGRILQFDPTTNSFSNIGDAGMGANATWFSILDPVFNRILRPRYSGGNGSNLDIYDITSNSWTTRQLGPYNSVGGEIHLEHTYLAVDRVGRWVYGISESSSRLHRFSLDLPLNKDGTYAIEDLGPVPVGDNEHKIVWDPYSKVLLYASLWNSAFYAYHPDTRQWESLGVGADNGSTASGKILFYDELNNVLGWFGHSDPSPHLESMPYLFLYRYAPASNS